MSSISGGVIISPTHSRGATEYMDALCRDTAGGYWTDTDTIQKWGEYTVQNKDWLMSLGAPLTFYRKAAEYPQFAGADSIEVWRFKGRGLRMMEFMERHVNSRNIEVLYHTAAERLLTDETGRVMGVKTGHSFIKALKAVILCTGGFEDNAAMKLQYLRMSPVYFTGGRGNTGDGIKMAQDVGADLWHMNCVSARLVAKFPEFPIAFPLDFGDRGRSASLDIAEKAGVGFVIVDKYGRRYINENMKLHGAFYELTGFDSHKMEYPKVPSYHIFDQKRMTFGPLVRRTSGPSGPNQLYKWSLDNSVELAKGWITGGDTVSELATKIGMPPENLQETISKWNRDCQRGGDPELGRNPLDLVPLDNPPFYAVALYPGGPNTQGGPRRNSKSQVLNPFGDPIPGLYAAGQCGSVYGMLYPTSGGNLAECIAFGRIAAENAVRESSIGSQM
jgi:succinate dehydrogenase/fumarate reductase flavoprotein subunit